MKKKFYLLLLIILTVGLTGCQMGNSSQSRVSAIDGNKSVLWIGAAWPFASRGDNFAEGMQMAVDEINGQGGVMGRQISIIKKDDHGSVTDGMDAAQQFASNPDIMAVIGHRSSYISVPTSTIYQRAGILMLSPASTSPELTAHDDPLVFRSIPSDALIGSEMARYAENKGYQRIAVFYEDDAYGRGLANAFETSAAELQLHVMDRISLYADQTELQNIAERWRLLGVQAVFMAETMPDAAGIIQDFRRVGMDWPILGGDGLDSEQLLKLGKDAEGTVVASIYNPENNQNPLIAPFEQQFQQKFSRIPGKWAAQGYDAVKLLAYAVKQANSVDPVKVAEVLRRVENWRGVTGFHTYQGSGDVTGMEIVKKMVVGGRFQYRE